MTHNVERRLSTVVYQLAQHLIEGPPPRARRWATIDAVNTGPDSVDIIMDGALIPAVRYLGWYTPSPGDTVVVLIEDNDPIVYGTLA